VGVERERKGKRTSNQDWASKTDADARVMRLKDGRTRLVYKAEHVVAMETGAVIAAEIHEATEGDTATIAPNLEQARVNIAAVKPTEAGEKEKKAGSDDEPPSAPPGSSRAVMEVVADKGYHKAELLRDLKRAQYRTYISVLKQKGVHHWKTKGGIYTEQAFRDNQKRVRRDKRRALMRLRGEQIERRFAHACETGGHRRVRLRGRANVRKRYLGQVAAMNLGLVLCSLLGSGTPRGLAAARKGLGLAFELVTAVMAAVVTGLAAIRFALGGRSVAAPSAGITCRPQLRHSSTGC
jgi:DDE family transposase